MRMMMQFSIPVEAGNHAARTGAFGPSFQKTLKKLKPEAAYFLEEEGERTAILIVDMKETSQIPSVAEPFFLRLNARVRIHPVMTPEDLGKSAPAIEQAVKKYA